MYFNSIITVIIPIPILQFHKYHRSHEIFCHENSPAYLMVHKLTLQNHNSQKSNQITKLTMEIWSYMVTVYALKLSDQLIIYVSALCMAYAWSSMVKIISLVLSSYVHCYNTCIQNALLQYVNGPYLHSEFDAMAYHITISS